MNDFTLLLRLIRLFRIFGKLGVGKVGTVGAAVGAEVGAEVGAGRVGRVKKFETGFRSYTLLFDFSEFQKTRCPH